MNRRGFLKSCGMAVVGLVGVGAAKVDKQLGIRQSQERYGSTEDLWQRVAARHKALEKKRMVFLARAEEDAEYICGFMQSVSDHIANPEKITIERKYHRISIDVTACGSNQATIEMW